MTHGSERTYEADFVSHGSASIYEADFVPPMERDDESYHPGLRGALPLVVLNRPWLF